MRLPAYRRPLALSAAAGALAFGSPALAQPEGGYEYAQPAPDQPPAPDQQVVFRSDPVIQAVPAPPAPPPPVESYAQDEAVDLPPPPPMPPVPPMAHMPPPPAAYAATPPGGYAAGQPYYPPYPQGGYAQPARAQFDRDAWLDDCHDRIRGVSRKDREAVIGGLLGAVAGGVIGNRVWDSNRTAGTLIGAGVGGLAGVAVGSAVGAARERRRDDECALYLDRYMAGGYAESGNPGGAYSYGYPGQGYGYGCGCGGYGYALVPVLVPQRQVIRETVTEEWVDEPVRARSIPRPRHHVAPRPNNRPDKRIKLIKGN